jgi:spoIIIJ-associated protein
VKDRAFTGRDVAEAVASAAEVLGLPAASIRYFVLDPGRPGGLGVTPSPARIAVLMEAHAAPSRPAPPPEPAAPPEDGPDRDARDPEAELHRLVSALAEAAGTGLEAEVVAEREAWTVRLRADDPGFLLGAEGDGDVLAALEHLLHRALAPAVYPLKLKVELIGQRERRDASIRDRAEALVAEVKRDGQARATPPLNAYERRLVHMVAAIRGGVTSRSEGEGAGRRVVIAPAPADDGPGGEVF